MMLKISNRTILRVSIIGVLILSLAFFTNSVFNFFQNNISQVKGSYILGLEFPNKSNEVNANLNSFKEANNLTLEQLSNLLSLLNIQGSNVNFSYKGDSFSIKNLYIGVSDYYIDKKKYLYPVNDSITIISGENVLLQKALPEMRL